jgi:hypothetical protein
MIQAIIPLIPLITKIIDAKHSAKAKDNKIVKEVIETAKVSTGKTEIAQGGYIYVLYSIFQTVNGCAETITLSSLSCVSVDQWVMLSAFVSMVFATFRAKVKA